jgi:uncharacterized protein (DUF433 family)
MLNQLDRITINPHICLGQPTIRGMRITVAFILKLLASKLSIEEILAAYPELDKLSTMQLGKFQIKLPAFLQHE